MRTTKTDRETSICADEFVWDTDEHTEVHKYVTPPILARLKEHKTKHVLDLGCGNGAFTNTLSTEGYQATGLDYSRTGIDCSQAKYPDALFERHDIAEPLPTKHIGLYDAVISIEVIEHLLLPRKLMENAIAALQPGGLFIVTTPYHGYCKNIALALTNKFDDHWHPLRDHGHVKFFSRSTLIRIFQEYGFKDIRYQTVGRMPAFARSMIVSGKKPT